MANENPRNTGSRGDCRFVYWRYEMTDLKDDIAQELANRFSDNPYYLDNAAQAIRDLIIARIPPLVFEQGRNNYWGHKSHGYQVAWNSGNLWRVRLNGRVICKQIKGHPEAVRWANAHHVAQLCKGMGIEYDQ